MVANTEITTDRRAEIESPENQRVVKLLQHLDAAVVILAQITQERCVGIDYRLGRQGPTPLVYGTLVSVAEARHRLGALLQS